MAGQSLGFVDDGAVGFSSSIYGQLVDMVLEYVPDLTWPLSIRTFARMRWDPTLQSALKAYTLPIRRASWALDPAGCRPEVAQFVADQMGLPLLGADAKPGPARRRGVSWADHLRVSLLDLTFGHMPFERTYTDVDPTTGRQRIDVLQERMPQTISQININRDGSLAEVTQNIGVPTADATPVIPAQNLVWYAHDREGSAWMGQSLLRPAYASWLLKDEMRRVLATSSRRFGMGVPAVKAPPGGTPTQTAQASALASAIRVGDQSGVGLPDGFTLELQGITGSVPDTLAFIRYLDGQMSRETLTGLLDLGDTSNGSRALGDSFLDLFILALQSIADDHAGTATSQIVVPLVDVNWGEDEPAPRIVCGDVGSEHAVTATAIAALVTSGALQPDPALDAFIRGEWKLPPREASAKAAPIYAYDLNAGVVTINDRRQQLGLDPLPDGDVTPQEFAVAHGFAAPTTPAAATMLARGKGRRVNAAVASFRRQPTDIEAKAKTDFAKVQADWEAQLDALVASWDTVTKAQRKELLAKIGQAVDDDEVDQLATLAVDSKAAAELLAEHMQDLADEAAQQQADEAKAQGVSIDAGQADSTRIAGMAAVVAAALASSLVDGSTRKALQAWTPGATKDSVTGAVDTWLSSLTDAGLRDQLGGGLTLAQGAGRSATLDVGAAAGFAAKYYASEILDPDTCDACEEEDGVEFDSLDDANAAYASGGYAECEGGLRCRGIVVTVWEDGTASQDEAA
jgi:hypothetical protein